MRRLDAALVRSSVIDNKAASSRRTPGRGMSNSRAVVITVSDACSRGDREDASGEALKQLITDLGAELVDSKILSDDLDPLVQTLREFAEREDVNLIVTTGGTGLGPRDN